MEPKTQLNNANMRVRSRPVNTDVLFVQGHAVNEPARAAGTSGMGMGVDIGAEVGVGVAVDVLTTSAVSWWPTMSCTSIDRG